MEGKTNEEIEQIKKVFSPLENIVLNSQYVVLPFFDRADGNNLSLGFALNLIQNKRMLIKSVRLIPYAFAEMDVLYNDTAGDHFTIPALARIPESVIDTLTTSTRIEIEINGTTQNLFPSLGNQAYNMDLFVDNIYYNYKAPINNLNVRVTGEVFTDLDAGTVDNPSIKVLIECYLY